MNSRGKLRRSSQSSLLHPLHPHPPLKKSTHLGGTKWQWPLGHKPTRGINNTVFLDTFGLIFLFPLVVPICHSTLGTSSPDSSLRGIKANMHKQMCSQCCTPDYMVLKLCIHWPSICWAVRPLNRPQFIIPRGYSSYTKLIQPETFQWLSIIL